MTLANADARPRRQASSPSKKNAKNESADSPGLVYVSDDIPGLSRARKGDDFIYRLPDGKPLRDEAQLTRIRLLAIPPAYTEVWICPLPHGHLQATGRDARGRKQYRYHAEWRSARDASKFERMQAFGHALPRIRARVKRELVTTAQAPLARNAVLAAIVRLLDTTLVRVGNDEYARKNKSFGLTTLRTRHADLKGSVLRLHFRGKSGVQHEVALDDPRVAKIVRRSQALPGQELFQWQDDAGVAHTLGSTDVNDYLREASGADFTAKDFRTWHGSVIALELWRRTPEEEDASARTANALLARVAERLGNTVAVCRKAYVHPRVLSVLTGAEAPSVIDAAARRAGLTASERAFLAFLKTAS